MTWALTSQYALIALGNGHHPVPLHGHHVHDGAELLDAGQHRHRGEEAGFPFPGRHQAPREGVEEGAGNCDGNSLTNWDLSVLLFLFFFSKRLLT